MAFEYTQSPQVFDLYEVLSKKGERQLEEIATALDHRYGHSETLGAAFGIGIAWPARIETDMRLGLVLRAQASNPVIPHFLASLFEGSLIRAKREFALEQELTVAPTVSFLAGRERYVNRVSTDLLDTVKVEGAGAFGLGGGIQGTWRHADFALRGAFHSTSVWHGAEQIRGLSVFTTWAVDSSWAPHVQGWSFELCGGLSNSVLCDMPSFEPLEELHVYYGRYESLSQVMGGVASVSWTNGVVTPGLRLGWLEGGWQGELRLRGGGHEVRIASIFRSTGTYFRDAMGRQYRLSYFYSF